MKRISDEHLMKEVSRGNLGALTFLFNRYHKQIYFFLLKMSCDKIKSEDLTQEVFYNILKYKKTYKGTLFKPWIYSIARNTLAKHFKEKKNKTQDIDDILYLLTSHEEINDDVMQLYHALSNLEPKDRELLILNKLEGIKIKELSEIMNVPEGTIKVRIHRAMKKLKNSYFTK